MLDLDKLNRMLEEALEAETSESFNQWIDEQIKQEQANEVAYISECGILSLQNISTTTSLEKSIAIKNGMQKTISYNEVVLSDSFESTVLDEVNFAA